MNRCSRSFSIKKYVSIRIEKVYTDFMKYQLFIGNKFDDTKIDANIFSRIFDINCDQNAKN